MLTASNCNKNGGEKHPQFPVCVLFFVRKASLDAAPTAVQQLETLSLFLTLCLLEVSPT